jgi:hypothetical protein
MRVVTRPDFDGVVCAVLLMDALQIEPPTLWVQPSDMQHGRVEVRTGDVIANLPYHENCALWFDHHYSNRPTTEVPGVFKIAPSAAGIIYHAYRDRFERDYAELVRQTDRIDSADLTIDEILHPQQFPYVLLSMTISGSDTGDRPYWELLVQLLRTRSLEQLMDHPEVDRCCKQVVSTNVAYEKALRTHTIMHGHVSVTDFRQLESPPNGNRFLVYSLFPECTVNVKILFDDGDTASIKVGHSILNRGCNVNVGQMLANFEGGGHPGAGACRFAKEKAPQYLKAILEILKKNHPL